MTWKELKAFANALPAEELDKNVVMWREDEVVTNIEAFQLEEEYFIDADDLDTKCFPGSDCKDLDPDIPLIKVYAKDYPLLFEVFFGFGNESVPERSVPDRLSTAIDVMKDEIQQLQGWKTSQLAVMRKLDLQAIGKEIGAPLGSSIAELVLPYIKALKQRETEKE